MARKHPAPIYISRDGKRRVAHPLVRVRSQYPESWLQELLYAYPQLLPIQHLRSDAGSLACIAREVRTEVGKIDNLYLSSGGYPVIVETKLWKNPQSRREALAQTLDYVHELAKHDFGWFESQWMESRPNHASLVEHMATIADDDDEFDESTFIDRVNRAMRSGDILAMIVGDGIQTRMQGLVDHLCRASPHLRYSLALVELACYVVDADGSEQPKPHDDLIVVPRIVCDVEPVERAHVRIEVAKELEGRITVSPVINRDPPKPGGVRPSLTEDEFFAAVRQSRGEDFEREFREFYGILLSQLPLEPELKGRIMLKVPDPDQDAWPISVLSLVRDGTVYNPRHLYKGLIGWGASAERAAKIANSYWSELNAIDTRFPLDGSNQLKGKYADFAHLREKTGKILDATRRVISAAQDIRDASSEGDPLHSHSNAAR